jgi:hypothetical protein
MGGQFGGFRVSRSALLLMGAVMVLALGVTSCAKPPQMEMDAAKAAIEKAKQMEAAEYAPNELRAASDTLAACDAEVNTQNGKFALFRSYKKAKAQALSAQALGQGAEQAAIKNKEQAKKDAEAALEQAKANIAAFRTMLASKDAVKLAHGKETREVLKQMQSEINATDSSLVGVTALQQQEKYKQALAQAKSLGDKATTLTQELQKAIEERATIQGMKKGAPKK